MARDPLRSTLDNLQVDSQADADRPYLEAALRRMGYTEEEIRLHLAKEAAPAPQPTKTAEYRLVKPMMAATRRPGLQSPFEDLQGELEFGDAPQPYDNVQPTGVEFQEVSQEPVYDVAFEEVPEGKRGKGLVWDETQPQDAEDLTIDTFGTADGSEGAGAPRTRVRIRRVRAKNRSEAEAKMAGQGRRVIKAVPVDIVERWGSTDEKVQ